MKDHLIQSLSNYATALEQKVSALEQRIALMEEKLDALNAAHTADTALITTLQAEVATLAAVGVVTSTNEPEVEIELIVDENEVLDNLETLENLDTPETNEIPSEEPIVEEKIEEQQAEELSAVEIDIPIVPQMPQSVEEPTPQPQPASRPVATQTSLFGAAVEDIRQAISLGDRFLFQRELFAGNGELMQKTLDEINALESLNEAMNYVLDNFDWDKESTAVQLFENVLKRRFN